MIPIFCRLRAANSARLFDTLHRLYVGLFARAIIHLTGVKFSPRNEPFPLFLHGLRRNLGLEGGLPYCALLFGEKYDIFTYEIPYENAKEMLLVEEVDNKDFLTGLFDVMYDELPTPKPKKKK